MCCRRTLVAVAATSLVALGNREFLGGGGGLGKAQFWFSMYMWQCGIPTAHAYVVVMMVSTCCSRIRCDLCRSNAVQQLMEACQVAKPNCGRGSSSAAPVLLVGARVHGVNRLSQG